MPENTQIRVVGLEELDRDWEPVIEVCLAAAEGQAWSREDSPSAHEFGVQLGRHAGRTGFRAIEAVTATGEIVGFGYGYSALRGHMFPDLVAKAIGPVKSEVWLSDTFSLTELVVRPEWGSRGIGSRLLEKLLAESGHTRSILSAREDSSAIDFYLHRGWSVILPGFRFPGGTVPFSILGRMLNSPLQVE